MILKIPVFQNRGLYFYAPRTLIRMQHDLNYKFSEKKAKTSQQAWRRGYNDVQLLKGQVPESGADHE